MDRDLCSREDRIPGNGLDAVVGPGDGLGSYHKEDIGAEFHCFMNLPPEIRIMIYKCCLIKGTIFMPRGAFTCRVQYKKKYTTDGRMDPVQAERYRGIPEDWGGLYAAKKSIGLLCGVSRTVQAEALPIFYGQNRFVLPYGLWGIPGLLELPGTSIPPYRNIGGCMRDLGVGFDARDDAVASRSRAICPPDLTGEGDAADKMAFWQACHELRRCRVVHAWRCHIWHFQAMELHRLQLCFRECYCPMGCCRLVRSVMAELEGAERLLPPTWEPPFPKEVEVVGWWNEDEKELIDGTLKRVFRCKVPVKITFVGDGIEEGS
ncbi:hypothetical protein F4818DRAFT_444450 [Hypoxylon cercidicola]|nr:hypothetical protein F4818DRAFT_444450 [Hypoxylon cercidicola]